jgi:hypothetical protein
MQGFSLKWKSSMNAATFLNHVGQKPRATKQLADPVSNSVYLDAIPPLVD